MIGAVKKLNIEQGTEEQGILNWRTRRFPLTPKGELRAQRISLTPKGELEGTKNTSIHFTIKPNSKQKSPLGGDLGGDPPSSRPRKQQDLTAILMLLPPDGYRWKRSGAGNQGVVFEQLRCQ